LTPRTRIARRRLRCRNPSKPIFFPDNFPDEIFYQLADSTVTLPGGGKAVSSFNLEGAFGGGPVKANDQIVFGRVRFFYKGLQPGATYRITHPYGVDEIQADASGAIRFTEDGGLSIGNFGEALNSRIGPFLKWDTGAPAGYLGDGVTAHAVTGSPYNTNFVHIEAIKAPDADTPLTPLDVQNNQFTVMGKLATTGGVGVDRVTYSRSGTSGGTLDVSRTPKSTRSRWRSADPASTRRDSAARTAITKLASTSPGPRPPPSRSPTSVTCRRARSRCP